MFGDLLGAGMRLLGGFLDRNQARDQMQAQQQMAANNIALQREFAQSGIQWRVADAHAAGIHPLYAMGANTTSFSPVSLGSTSSPSMSDTLGAAGQDIGRAINATSTQSQREARYAAQVKALGLEKAQLENDVLRTAVASNIQKVKQQNNPPIPVDSPEPFPVAENKKAEERPPLMLFGKRWQTNPNTSPMKAWEDQYGDEGPVSWTMPLVIGANDVYHNMGRVNRWLQGLRRSPVGAREWWHNR